MRDHCAFAKLNGSGRCIADCHRNLKVGFKHDCEGITREREEHLEIEGREYQLGGRFKKNHGTKL